jgi:hypothetical protein
MQSTRGIAFILLCHCPFSHSYHLAGGDSKPCRQDNYMMICFMLVFVCEGIKYFSVVSVQGGVAVKLCSIRVWSIEVKCAFPPR